MATCRAPCGTRKMTRNSRTPNTAPDRPFEIPSAMFGTKMMKAEPTIDPGSQPTPPTTMPRNSEIASVMV